MQTWYHADIALVQKWYHFLIDITFWYHFCFVTESLIFFSSKLTKKRAYDTKWKKNIYSYIIKGLLHWYREILSLVGISTDARKLASDIPTRDNIRRYQCNNNIIFHRKACTKVNSNTARLYRQWKILVIYCMINHSAVKRNPVAAVVANLWRQPSQSATFLWC